MSVTTSPDFSPSFSAAGVGCDGSHDGAEPMRLQIEAAAIRLAVRIEARVAAHGQRAGAIVEDQIEVAQHAVADQADRPAQVLEVGAIEVRHEPWKLEPAERECREPRRHALVRTVE